MATETTTLPFFNPAATRVAPPHPPDIDMANYPPETESSWIQLADFVGSLDARHFEGDGRKVFEATLPDGTEWQITRKYVTTAQANRPKSQRHAFDLRSRCLGSDKLDIYVESPRDLPDNWTFTSEKARKALVLALNEYKHDRHAKLRRSTFSVTSHMD